MTRESTGARRGGTTAGPIAPRLRMSVALALLALATSLSALDPDRAITQYMHDAWEVEDGLPASSVTAIVQSRDGFLWLATQDGIVRFDGVRFSLFDRKTTPEIRDQYIQCLIEDRAGRIWAGTDSGGLVSYAGGRFRRYSVRDGLPSDRVLSLFEDRDGRLWAGTERGVAWLDGERFRLDPALEELEDKRIRTIRQDHAGAIWIGTRDNGVRRLHSGTLTAITEREGLASDDVWSLLEDRNGIVWVGTRGGLSRLDGGAITTIATRDGLTNPVVRSLLEDRDGNLWIGTRGGGLNRFHGGRLTALSTRNGISADAISAIFEDREGSLWFGTEGAGLHRLRTGKLMSITTREGLPVDNAGPILEDRDGNLWIGTDGGGLSRLRDEKLTTITTREGLKSDAVRSLLEDREGGLWIGTREGLHRLHEGRLSTFTERDGLSKDIIWSMAEDGEGTIWIGTEGGGLNQLRDGRFTAITTRDGLLNNVVRALFVDSRGVLWIGTDGGLNRLHEGKLTAVTAREGRFGEKIRALFEDREGNFWIGTRGGGLNLLQDGRLRAITTRDGLFDDIVWQILEDDLGNLWMSCNKGIFRVPKRELLELASGRRKRVTSVAYGAADGMASANCWGGFQPAGWKSRDGRLWFPTTRGVAVVDPRQLPRNEVAPPVAIEEVLVNEKLVPRTAVLSLTPGTEKLEIHYTALSLVAPERVRFKYRLDGYDRDWVDPGTRRTAYYTKVPHGDYTFRVIACNNDGVWNEEGARLSFSVPPRYYETWWFYLLCALSVASAMFAAYKTRTGILKAKARELALLVEERTQSLREALDQAERERTRVEEERRHSEAANRAKSVFLANMSHELRTPLNGILGFVQLMDRDRGRNPEDRQNLATILRCGDTLLGLINDVLSLSKIEAGRVSLDRAPFDLGRLLLGIEEMLRIRAESQDLTLTSEIAPGMPRAVIGDEGRLRQILTNLLGNAIKFTERGGVKLRAHWADGRAVFEIEDTGPGIAAEELKQLFAPFVQTESGRSAKEGSGLGLAISRSFARLMDGDITVASELGHGARFTVEVALPEAPADALVEDRGARETRRVVGLAPELSTFRILVVDDLTDNRVLLTKLLAAVGFEVREAADGAEALRTWREWRPDLIWMDTRMPRMDGIEATKIIRREERERDEGHVVIIALSASALEHEQGDILAAGCDDFLPKPFREDAIFAKMAAHLGIKYRYEIEEAAAPPASAELSAARFAALPSDWITELRKAITAGDVREAGRITDRIAEHDASLASTLRQALREFRLDEIEAALVPEKDG